MYEREFLRGSARGCGLVEEVHRAVGREHILAAGVWEDTAVPPLQEILHLVFPGRIRQERVERGVEARDVRVDIRTGEPLPLAERKPKLGNMLA